MGTRAAEKKQSFVLLKSVFITGRFGNISLQSGAPILSRQSCVTELAQPKLFDENLGVPYVCIGNSIIASCGPQTKGRKSRKDALSVSVMDCLFPPCAQLSTGKGPVGRENRPRSVDEEPAEHVGRIGDIHQPPCKWSWRYLSLMKKGLLFSPVTQRVSLGTAGRMK